MDFLGIDISTPGGARKARLAHARLLRDYMAQLDRFRRLPACEELTARELKARGYDAQFLDSLETLTCLPPPGDAIYQGEDSPFSLQYEDMILRMGEDPEVLKKEGQEYHDGLSPEEKEYNDLLAVATTLTTTFFMLSLDWSQVGVIGNLPFCTPKGQLEMLGLLSMACGSLKAAYDRIASRLDAAAQEEIKTGRGLARAVHSRMEEWSSRYPQYAEALKTRLALLQHTLEALDNLSQRLARLGNESPLS